MLEMLLSRLPFQLSTRQYRASRLLEKGNDRSQEPVKRLLLRMQSLPAGPQISPGSEPFPYILFNLSSLKSSLSLGAGIRANRNAISLCSKIR